MKKFNYGKLVSAYFFKQVINLMLLKTLLITCLGCVSYSTIANDNNVDDLGISPIVERKDVLDDVLDSENFEIGLQGGLLSIEDFESSGWVSAHLAYHVTEYFYVKARYGLAEAGTTSFEKLSNTSPLLTDEQRELTYYGLNVGYNLMPGEIFLGKGLAFNSVFSVELGAGTTEFAGDDNFTVNLSTNYRVFINDWFAWDIGVSDYIFDTIVTGETKTTHNLNFTTGFAVYF